MLPILALIFIAVPMIEIAFLVKLGTVIGFWPTLLLQIGSGVAGALLARMEGLWVWRKIALELQSG
ncbi:MAG TPA: FxsA family protein, partial [Candidatus Manganitrophaceae bacterium]|nr:FxsA family protein [Candidatus Manganitrophaceae bacterium]